MAKLAPIVNNAQFMNGIPANGAKLFFYAAGSSTKQTTYADEAGLIPQTNPVILDSRGEPSQPIWFTEGLAYKIVFAASTDTDPPVSPIWDVDNVTGINDASLTIDQWVDSGVTPTYVSATSFTLPGDQTSSFMVGRRIKALVTAGTAYGRITSSVFGAVTTVGVAMDSTPLDSGLSSVQLGLLTPTNSSVPALMDSTLLVSGSADRTKLARFEADGITTATTRTYTFPDKDITFAGLADVSGGSNFGSKIQPVTASVATNALTITLNPTTLDFRSNTLGSGTVTTVSNAAAISVVVSSGSTLGTANAIASRLAVLAINNAGTMELAVVNVAGSVLLDDATLISTTAEGGAGAADSANVIYSTTARASVAFRIVGYIESTQATAGTWATAPSVIQGSGGDVKVQRLVSGTAVASTSGTAINFSSIPSWVKRITVTFAGVSTNGTNNVIMTIGDSGGLEVAGYAGAAGRPAGATAFTTAFGLINAMSAVVIVHGQAIITLLDAATNTWVYTSVLARSDSADIYTGGGSKSLSATLDRLSITTAGGTDTFDAGTINIIYE